jgi:hypothetical protein
MYGISLPFIHLIRIFPLLRPASSVSVSSLNPSRNTPKNPFVLPSAMPSFLTPKSELLPMHDHDLITATTVTLPPCSISLFQLQLAQSSPWQTVKRTPGEDMVLAQSINRCGIPIRTGKQYRRRSVRSAQTGFSVRRFR